jgi:hypothetical protein
MKDPTIMALIGQNPQAGKMMAAMQAHIAEHVGFGYRQKIEQQLGMPLPPEDEKLPPEIEIALSGMMAQAAQQVLQQSQQQAAQQQAQQQAQDPVLQMQQQELQLKAQDLQIKDKKVLADAAAKSDDLELRKQELDARMELEGRKLTVQTQKDAVKLAADQEREGTRMGIDIAKAKAQTAAQAQQRTKPTK